MMKIGRGRVVGLAVDRTGAFLIAGDVGQHGMAGHVGGRRLIEWAPG